MVLNTTQIIKGGTDFLSNLSQKGITKLSEAGANPSPLVVKLIPFFIGALLIWLGSKISGKIAKVIMILLGILLMILIGYSWVV